MKADWLDIIDEGPKKGPCYVDKAVMVPGSDMLSSLTPLSSLSPSSSASSSASFFSTDSNREVSYVDICQLIGFTKIIPAPVVRAQTIFCSRVGLALYNKEHGTNYKPVKPLLSGRDSASPCLWFHCNFTAAELRKDNTPCDPKLFYVSFGCRNVRPGSVQCCIIEDATKAFHKTCDGCPPNLAHCPCGLHRHAFKIFNNKVCKLITRRFQQQSNLRSALKWFSKKYGASYKLLKDLGYHFKVEGELHERYHTNFKAMRYYHLNDVVRDHDSSDKIFFADYVVHMHSLSLKILDCCILDAAENLDSLLHIQLPVNDCCKLCPPGHGILHPPNYIHKSFNDLLKESKVK